MTSLLDAPPERSGKARVLGVAGTVAVHGVMILGASLLGLGGVTALEAAPVTEMVEVALPEPPKPAAPEPEAPKAVPPAPRIKAEVPAAEPPPDAKPQAAEAGQVLDAKADVADFGDTFVSGSGDSYAGGVTDRTGTSKTAVSDVNARGAGSPAVEKPKAVDLSRAPKLAGGAQWQCPFPIEADDAGIDHAVVTLRVEVDAVGGVQRVTATTDPGSGFGREARRCATSKRWAAGLDRDGRPISAIAIVNVRFDRQ